jgi:hypothetical protein
MATAGDAAAPLYDDLRTKFERYSVTAADGTKLLSEYHGCPPLRAWDGLGLERRVRLLTVELAGRITAAAREQPR